jgi:uncharacterized membrane protein YtjA (UPF0391 family)
MFMIRLFLVREAQFLGIRIVVRNGDNQKDRRCNKVPHYDRNRVDHLCVTGRKSFNEIYTMLKWALIFLIVGLIAGVLGFTTIAGASIAIAKLLFFVFLALFVIFLVLGMSAARKLTNG